MNTRILLCAVACALLFAALAIAVALGGAPLLDQPVRVAVHAWGSPSLTALARLFSFIGSAPFWNGIVVFAVAALWSVGRRRQALALVVTMAGAVVLENVLKFAFHRARPGAFFGAAPATFSFPSGHALFAACLYGALAAILAAEVNSRILRALIWTAAAILALCIGLSRVYLGVHYPTDVLAGYSAGGAWLGLLLGTGLDGRRAPLA